MNDNLLDSYLGYLRVERRLSDNTCESYKIDLIQFNTYIKNRVGNVKVEKISKEVLNDYILYLKDNYKESSYLRKVASLKSFNNYLISIDMPGNDYIELLEAKKREKRLPKYLSQNEIDDFLNNLDVTTNSEIRNKAMFETLYATGMRVSEIINIKVQDVNLENMTIRVEGKGKKQRIVILNETAVSSLENYMENARIQLMDELTDYLFLNQKGHKMTRQGFNYILKQKAKEVGIVDISPHIFRHSIATHMLNNGGDLRLIQTLLGHANITTTEIYTHVSKKKVLEEYEKMHPLAKEKYEKI